MENLVVSAKKKVTLDKFVSTVRVSTQNEIKEILNVSARSVIGSAEQANSVVSLAGRVFVNVIYLSKDGEVLSAEGSVDFIEKQQMQYALSDLFASDNVSVQMDTFSSLEVLCSVTHNTRIFGIYRYEIADFVGENTSFVLNKKSFNSLQLIAVADDNFVVAEEADSNVKNMRVLSSSAKVVSYEAAAAVDKIVVDGKIAVEVVYDDTETIGACVKEFEFKQEIAAASVVPNMLALAYVEVKNVTVTPEEGQDKTHIVYAIDVYAKGYAYEENTYEIATDMFSLDSELENTYDYLEVKNYSSTKKQNEVVMSSTNISEIENFDDIVGVYSPEFKLSNIVEDGEKVYAEGNIVAYALYKEEEQIKKLDVVSPVKFEVIKDLGEVYDDFCAYVEISSFKVKAGKELEVAFKLDYSVSFGKNLSESFIKSFEVKDAKQKSEAGIKVYVTKQGETLFDVAKVLSVRPEMILEQNEVDDVFEQGEKIYVYSPINIM